MEKEPPTRLLPAYGILEHGNVFDTDIALIQLCLNHVESTLVGKFTVYATIFGKFVFGLDAVAIVLTALQEYRFKDKGIELFEAVE